MSNTLIFYTNQGVKLNFEPLVSEFQEYTSKYSHWIMQHWQGLPKPIKGVFDIRKFAYLCKEDNNYIYHTIDYKEIIVEEPIMFIPLQIPFTNTIPTAVNFIPNAVLVLENKKFYLRKYRG